MAPAHLRIFDPFMQYKPEQFLSNYHGWIELILFVVLFTSIAGIALPSRLTQGRHGRILIGSLGLILAVALYNAKKLFNFSFESFAFLGIWMVIIVFALVFFGLVRGLGMRADIAFPLTYCTVFVSFLAIKPTLYDSIATFLPILNGIFIVGFIYLLFQLLSKMFMHSKSPRFVAKQMERFENPEKGRIDKEIRDDRREQKLIKRQTMKITNKEIQSIEDMEKYLEQVIDIVEKNGANLDEHQKSEVVSSLQKIGANEEILRKGMENIIRHLQAYEQHHKKDLKRIEAAI